jgi:hypothetical protein
LVPPNEPLWLSIRLHIPYPVDGALSCHPAGETADHSRTVLVLDCRMDQEASTDHLQATMHLAGEAHVDIATGVRLSCELTGWLKERMRLITTLHGSRPMSRSHMARRPNSNDCPLFTVLLRQTSAGSGS